MSYKIVLAMSLASMTVVQNPFEVKPEDKCTICQSIPGPKGENGRDGVDGKDGRDGRDGKDGETIIRYELPPIVPREPCNIPHFDAAGFLFVGVIPTDHGCFEQIAYHQATGSIYRIQYLNDGWIWGKMRPVPGAQAHGVWQIFQPFDPNWNNFVVNNLQGEFCFISDVDWDSFPLLPIYYLGLDYD